MRCLPTLLAVLSLAACGGWDRPSAPAPAAMSAPASASASASVSALASVSAPASVSASAAASSAPAEPDLPAQAAETSGEDAERVLFLATDLRTTEIRKTCPVSLPDDRRVRCLLTLRYEDEPASRALVLTLYAETGSLAGLLPEETSDDGRGGKVHLRPARPIGRNLEHLTWILAAFRDYQRFKAGLSARAPISFRDRPVDLRFFYSEKGQNPSMFAIKRNIGYNLYGVVNVSEEAVRDTLFHEIFHLNDGWHEEWSGRALAPIYERIIARCGRRSACLTPYAPSDTMMDGAIYAFARPASVREYAAELGLRYYREHRLVLAGKPLPVKPFKCGPPENLSAWQLLSAEFFGGVDLVPKC